MPSSSRRAPELAIDRHVILRPMAYGGQGCMQGGWCGIMLPGWYTHMDWLVLAGVVTVHHHFMVNKKRAASFIFGVDYRSTIIDQVYTPGSSTAAVLGCSLVMMPGCTESVATSAAAT